MNKFRYSLRNKPKIIYKLGQDYLNILIKSLNDYFKKNETVEEHAIEEYKLPIIFVPSSNKSEIDFMFAITGKKYNVYNLAYVSSVG